MTEDKTQEAVKLLENEGQWHDGKGRTFALIRWKDYKKALAILKSCEVCRGEKYICGGCEKPAGDITIHRGEHWILGAEPNLDEPCGPIIDCPKCQDHIVNSNKKVAPMEFVKKSRIFLQGKLRLRDRVELDDLLFEACEIIEKQMKKADIAGESCILWAKMQAELQAKLENMTYERDRWVDDCKTLQARFEAAEKTLQAEKTVTNELSFEKEQLQAQHEAAEEKYQIEKDANRILIEAKENIANENESLRSEYRKMKSQLSEAEEKARAESFRHREQKQISKELKAENEKLRAEKADREEYIGNLEAKILKETENG